MILIIRTDNFNLNGQKSCKQVFFHLKAVLFNVVSHSLQPSSMVKKTGYEVGHFVDCLKDLHSTYTKAESHPQQAVMEKYKVDK